MSQKIATHLENTISANAGIDLHTLSHWPCMFESFLGGLINVKPYDRLLIIVEYDTSTE